MREIKNRRKREYSEQKKRMSRGKQHEKKEWLRFFSELKKKKASQFIFLFVFEVLNFTAENLYIDFFFPILLGFIWVLEYKL